MIRQLLQVTLLLAFASCALSELWQSQSLAEAFGSSEESDQLAAFLGDVIVHDDSNCDVAPENITAENQQKLIDAHNNFRLNETNATGMFALRWNSEMAQRAQAWANYVVRQTSLSHGYKTLCNGTVMGQNIWSGPLSYETASSVSSWYSEKTNFVYDNNTCNPNKVCGHYTQVVWAKSYFLGCGSASFNKTTVVVCNYYPPGNFNGAYPYLTGKKSAAACKSSITSPISINWGVKLNSVGLCDFCRGDDPACSCYTCNNGTVIANSCKCACYAGYNGNQCENVCKDSETKNCMAYADRCGIDKYKTFMQNNCPCTCKKLGYKDFNCCV